MYDVKPTKRFKKDLKIIEKRGYNIDLLTDVIIKLSKGEQLEEKYHDHALKGEYKGCRECHITPDWLLIYKIGEQTLYLYLTRTGTHADLFV
ncbi:MAG: type II toxin-antitoxin system YafQ family toxin [Lachnospiraceae bacterium]|jgi:mRNA interferase YafQ|nr:type II toxin-antitoxin system YafQ family toxin [Lachnospiraceae bacterium]